MMIYYSFAELEQKHLASQAFWMPLAAIPHMDCCLAQGGFSGLLAELLLQLDAQGLDQGMFVGMDYAKIKLEAYVSDFEGLRSNFACSGAAGLKPCLLCQNVLSRGSIYAGTGDGDFATVSCGDPNRFQLVEQAQLESLLDTRGPATKKAF